MQAIITVGLGYGDEGKGCCVDFLARRHNAKLVIRYSGGAQCGHNVVGPSGKKHAFAQWGAGTFAGAGTYLGREVIISVSAMHREAEYLKAQGVERPFRHLVVHPDCLVATPLHVELNRFREEQRNARHGSCGMGIGATREYWLRYGFDAVFARDLGGSVQQLAEKLRLMQQRLSLECPLLRNISPVVLARELTDQGVVLWRGADPWDHFEIGDEDTVIFEGAQGILLDEHFGEQPHTTWSDVSPRHALRMCQEYVGYSLTASVIGVTRSYATRHGAGPLRDEWTGESRLIDDGNPFNEWQQTFRTAPLETLGRPVEYVREVCEAEGQGLYTPDRGTGADLFCGLAVSHLDQIPLSAAFTAAGVPPIVIAGRGPKAEDRRVVKEFLPVLQE
jgi:adenylosuccinate synthase